MPKSIWSLRLYFVESDTFSRLGLQAPETALRMEKHLSRSGTAKELTTGSIPLTSYYSQIIDPLLIYNILNTIMFILVFFLLINQ